MYVSRHLQFSNVTPRKMKVTPGSKFTPG